MRIYTPYVYRLSWTKQGMHYIGCQSGKRAWPGDLWVSYFTASTYVKEFVEKYGHPDVRKIVRICRTPSEAQVFEGRYQRRVDAAGSDNFLNRSNNTFMEKHSNTGPRKWNRRRGIETVSERYGGVGSGVPEIKSAVQNTNNQRYGTHHTLHLKHVTTARVNGSLAKYGTTNPFYSQKFQASLSPPMHNPEVKARWLKIMENFDWSERNENSKKTNKERYGTEYTFQATSVKKKIKESMKKKYGVEFYVQSDEFKERMQKKKKPCPLCGGDRTFDPGNMTNHLKKIHKLTKDEILELKENGKT